MIPKHTTSLFLEICQSRPSATSDYESENQTMDDYKLHSLYTVHYELRVIDYVLGLATPDRLEIYVLFQ
ncbi:hypothetical protein J6590_098627 [Homalodisca vitripennis]|nr:hypothetical protein J6590_098627 [Homalodisca vitripennis]